LKGVVFELLIRKKLIFTGMDFNPEYYNNIVQNAVEPKKHGKSKSHRELRSLFPKPPSIFDKHKYY